jgi:hypothetical protein
LLSSVLPTTFLQSTSIVPHLFKALKRQQAGRTGSATGTASHPAPTCNARACRLSRLDARRARHCLHLFAGAAGGIRGTDCKLVCGCVGCCNKHWQDRQPSPSREAAPLVPTDTLLAHRMCAACAAVASGSLACLQAWLALADATQRALHVIAPMKSAMCGRHWGGHKHTAGTEAKAAPAPAARCRWLKLCCLMHTLSNRAGDVAQHRRRRVCRGG